MFKLKNKYTYIIAILSLILSRLFFFFIDDPEGPNLLIVLVLAIIIYFVLLLLMYIKRKYFKFSIVLISVIFDNMIKEYIEYIKDNPQKLWFKRKLYGWGWTPATWQGWLVIFIYITFLFILGFHLDERVTALKDIWTTFLLPIIFLTAILIYICYKKGEKPKWQWGITKNNE